MIFFFQFIDTKSKLEFANNNILLLTKKLATSKQKITELQDIIEEANEAITQTKLSADSDYNDMKDAIDNLNEIDELDE
jgi:uncharacterized protein YlxW (UPF0749 family)